MPKRHNDTITLSALEEDILTLLQGRTLYGVEILTHINRARDSQQINRLKVGSLYPTLKRLETLALIVRDTNDRRQYYHLTEIGQATIDRTQAYRQQLIALTHVTS
jgi:PadR family transcriptional regulator, regulatory protein PadR